MKHDIERTGRNKEVDRRSQQRKKREEEVKEICE